jgi:hypothetical protein
LEQGFTVEILNPKWVVLQFNMEYLWCSFFLIIQENNMNEIKRFNKERRQDLVEMLKGFVLDQVEALNFITWFMF